MLFDLVYIYFFISLCIRVPGTCFIHKHKKNDPLAIVIGLILMGIKHVNTRTRIHEMI